MRLCLIICAMLLTGCAEKTRTVYAAPYVPADLLQPERVTCPPGYTAEALAICLFRQAAGLGRANEKLAAIDEILTKPEAKPH